MKHIIKTIVVLAMGTMLLTSFQCGKEEDINPICDICNTSWINERTETYEDEYGNLHESVETNIIKFESTTTGILTYGYVTPTENEKYDIPFTYTYSSPNGTITISDEGGSESFDFSFNADNNTLIVYGDGGYYLVFSQQ